MVDYGLKNKVAIITGANNPWGIGATAALSFAREGARVVLVYKRVNRPFDSSKTDRNGVDRYYAANAKDASTVEEALKAINADYLIIESDISKEDRVKEIYEKAINMYGKIDILVNNSSEVPAAANKFTRHQKASAHVDREGIVDDRIGNMLDGIQTVFVIGCRIIN